MKRKPPAIKVSLPRPESLCLDLEAEQPRKGDDFDEITRELEALGQINDERQRRIENLEKLRKGQCSIEDGDEEETTDKAKPHPAPPLKPESTESSVEGTSISRPRPDI